MVKKGCLEEGTCGVDGDYLNSCYNCNLSNNVLTCDCCEDRNYNCSLAASKMGGNSNFEPNFNTSVTISTCAWYEYPDVENNNGNLTLECKYRWYVKFLIKLLIVLAVVGVFIGLFYIIKKAPGVVTKLVDRAKSGSKLITSPPQTQSGQQPGLNNPDPGNIW